MVKSLSWLRVAPVSQLLSSHRHSITLRSRTLPITYHSILLFSFSNPPSEVPLQQPNSDITANDQVSASSNKRSWYSMVAQCPHANAPLENAPVHRAVAAKDGKAAVDEDEEIDFEEDIDDIEDAIIVCPWHEYDFSLSTGESTSGLRACTYKVWIDGSEEDGMLQVESPARQDNGEPGDWEITEIRPISESFPGGKDSKALQSRQAAAELLHKAAGGLSLSEEPAQQSSFAEASSSVLGPEPRPKTLVAWACLILNTPEPSKKVAYTRMAAEAFRNGECKVIGGGRMQDVTDVDGKASRQWVRKPEETPPYQPPREDHISSVNPGAEGRRGKGGSLRSRIAILHSLANIELWAIDLGWDIIARGPELFDSFKYLYSLPDTKETRSLPLAFYQDFTKLCIDEAKHFSLLSSRLESLGARFGDLQVHDGLWQQAIDTSHSLFARISLTHLVSESRGLDVNPMTILKMQRAGDEESKAVLEIIHADEITHVSCGHRHLLHLCSLPSPPLNPIEVFRSEVQKHFFGRLLGPFNSDDRLKAGLTREYYENLEGKNRPGWTGAQRNGVRREEVAGG